MMKVTKEQLKQVIKEELEAVIGESEYNREMERRYGDESQKEKLKQRIEKEKAEQEKADAEEAGDEESGTVKEEAVTEEQYFDILVRQDGFADAELLTKKEADKLLKPDAEFIHSEYLKGRYIAKVVKTADPER